VIRAKRTPSDRASFPKGALSSFEDGGMGKRQEDSFAGTSDKFSARRKSIAQFFICADSSFSALRENMASITLNRAKQVMTDCGMPMAVLAQVCGVRPSSISSVFRGVMTLDLKTEARLLSVACRISELKGALEPVRLPDEWESVAKMVEGLEIGRVSLDEIRAAVSRMLGQ
jgi:hypothetical protein